MREMLKEIAQKTRERTGKTRLHAVDQMDDGSVIALDISIDEEKVSHTWVGESNNSVL